MKTLVVEEKIIDRLKTFSVLFISFGLSALLLIIFNPTFFHLSDRIDADLGEKFGTLFAGVVGTTISIAGAFLVYATLMAQTLQEKRSRVEQLYFKFLEFHFQNLASIKVSKLSIAEPVSPLEGRQAFVEYRYQIRKLLDIVKKIDKHLGLHLSDDAIIDIAFLVFYYGISDEWEPFFKEKLKRYSHSEKITQELIKICDSYRIKKLLDIGRTNQTFVSAYFRNMYNSIKFIHEAEILTRDEKKKYIKVLRAQLSNPELYVLYFNVRSRFGKKWKDQEFVEEYELFTNIPAMYCEEFDHKKYFDTIKYEDDELNT